MNRITTFAPALANSVRGLTVALLTVLAVATSSDISRAIIPEGLDGNGWHAETANGTRYIQQPQEPAQNDSSAAPNTGVRSGVQER